MAKRNFTPADAWALRTVSDPNLSSDGRRVAYVVGEGDEENDRMATSIWVASSGQQENTPPRRFSDGPRDSSPRWSPDGRWLAYVGERDGTTQLFVAPLGGGAPRAVTDHAGGVTAPVWSPDSRRLAYTTRTGEWTPKAERSAVERSAPVVLTNLYNRYDNLGWLDHRRTHVWVADLDTESVRQVTDGDWDDFDPAWSPDGSQLAFVADRSATRWEVPRRDVWVVAAGGRRRPRRLTRGRGTAASPLFSPDGRTIAYVGHEHQAGDSSHNTHVMTVPVDGSRPPTSLTAGLDRTVVGTFPLASRTHAWTPDGAAVLFVANDAGRHQLYSVTDGAISLLAGGDRQLTAVDVAGPSIVFTAAWPSTPVEVYRTELDGSGERRVSNANKEPRAQIRLATLRRVTHRADDGSSVESFVLYPPGFKRGEPAPTVLEIHGGPHGCHPQMSMTALYQSLATAGYVVVLPNPRGSHGYGEEWAGRCVGDWGGADFADLMGAVDALVDKGIADPARLYVAGYSYGGFMTSWTVGHTDRFKAACVSAPVLDLVSMYGTTDIPYFSEFEIGGTPWERPDFYRERSPLSYLTDIATPVQVLHWDGDLRCPVSQADELFQGLRRLGRDAVLVRYPGGFHVARTPSQAVDFAQRHLDWFGAH